MLTAAKGRMVISKDPTLPAAKKKKVVSTDPKPEAAEGGDGRNP